MSVLCNLKVLKSSSNPILSRMCFRVMFLSSQSNITSKARIYGESKTPEDYRYKIRTNINRGRFKQALQISQMMSDHMDFVLQPNDIAIRLDMIYKVHGTKEAETYFHNIPKESRLSPVYNALLNCYAHGKCVEKAQALIREMEQLGLKINFSILLNLYYMVGQYEKVHIIMDKLKEKGMYLDNSLFKIQLNSYAATSNFDGIEKILESMEADPKISVTWSNYATVADEYIKAGMLDKALVKLKKSERLVGRKKRRIAYPCLFELYARSGRKDELYKCWFRYNSSGSVNFRVCRRMVQLLLELEDVEGAKKILEESRFTKLWELLPDKFREKEFEAASKRKHRHSRVVTKSLSLTRKRGKVLSFVHDEEQLGEENECEKMHLGPVTEGSSSVERGSTGLSFVDEENQGLSFLDEDEELGAVCGDLSFVDDKDNFFNQ